MLLLRVLTHTYEQLTKSDLVRMAKSSFRDSAILGLATRLLGTDGELVTDPVFLGSSLEPSADGTNALVTLKPGLALWYDDSEGDAWKGEVKPVFTDTEQTVALTTNTDASGDDRIDVIAVRPIETDEDTATRKFWDPTTETEYEQEVAQRTRRAFEFKVYEGIPAAAPVAPAIEAGYFKIAEVTRVNAQVNVNPADVTDSRLLDRIRAGTIDAFGNVAIRTGGLYFGDPAGNHHRIERDDEVSPTQLRARNQAGGDVDIRARDLISSGNVVTNTLQVYSGAVGDALEVKNFADDDYGSLVALNAPIAMASFYLPDGGGAAVDNDPATVSYGYNITSIVFKDGGAEDYFLVTFDVAIPEGALSVTHVTPGQRLSGGSLPQDNIAAAYVESGGATARVYFASGAVPTDQKYNLTVYGVA